MITKADKAVMYGLAAIALIAMLATPAYSKKIADRQEVVIYVDGQEAARYSLNSESKMVRVDGLLGTSVIKISASKARMLDSPCPRKTCRAQGWITSSHQAIICIPNRVVVKIESARGRSRLDAISR